MINALKMWFCETKTKFRELFAQISAETTIDEFIIIDGDRVTLELAVDTISIYWIQVSRQIILIMMTARKALPSVDRVKAFIEVQGDNELNIILGDIIGKVDT